jgi:hypothetical protein
MMQRIGAVHAAIRTAAKVSKPANAPPKQQQQRPDGSAAKPKVRI